MAQINSHSEVSATVPSRLTYSNIYGTKPVVSPSSVTIRPPENAINFLRIGKPSAWNEWIRYQRDCYGDQEITVELRGFRPRKECVNLEEVDLKHADLRKAFLFNARMTGADLSQANLEGADISWASLRYANLSGANLRKTYLCQTSLRGAYIQNALVDRRTIQNYLRELLCSTIQGEGGEIVTLKEALIQNSGFVLNQLASHRHLPDGLIAKIARVVNPQFNKAGVGLSDFAQP